MINLYQGDCLDILKTFPDNSVESLVTDPPAGISFMNKGWDSNKGGSKQWIAWMETIMRECLRVMKPGAHGLVWAIPRTSHWTATALENAGFEVRDVVTHLFGTGFPKSYNVAKGIDKLLGVEGTVIGKIKAPASTKTVQTMGRPENSGSGWNEEPDLTAPTSLEAKQWSGWGTALKPASEHWILVRKPCSEPTVASNVLKWGTGGLNIDAGRIVSANASTGRFPANLVLDEEAAAALDEQTGVLEPGGQSKKPRRGAESTFGIGVSDFGRDHIQYKDTGGASRFFYVAKASKADKGEANTHPTVKSTKLMEYLIKLITPPNGIVLDPFMGSGSTGVACKILDTEFVGIEKEVEYFEIAKKRTA